MAILAACGAAACAAGGSGELIPGAPTRSAARQAATSFSLSRSADGRVQFSFAQCGAPTRTDQAIIIEVADVTEGSRSICAIGYAETPLHLPSEWTYGDGASDTCVALQPLRVYELNLIGEETSGWVRFAIDSDGNPTQRDALCKEPRP